MTAGMMRRRVAFQSESEISDGAGGYEGAWTTQFTVWGSFKPERGSERVENGRLAETLAGVIRVRSSADTRTVTHSWRAIIDGVTYNIRSVSNPDQRSRFIEMTAERGGVGT